MADPRAQSTNAVLVVYPTSFAFNEQTSETNFFQTATSRGDDEVRLAAQKEFEGLVRALRDHDIEVLVYEDEAAPAKPDAVFPNNWLSTWPDGRIYLYPMANENRRPERNHDAIRRLGDDFLIKEIVDLSESERDGRFLEGTGAIVFDHANRLAYACISPRCSAELLRTHARDLGYRPVVFRAVDHNHLPVYHTNVVMGVQTTTAVVCGASIADDAERDEVLDALREHHSVVDISMEQMSRFCGNVIELRNSRDELFLVMSRTAHDNFMAGQLRVLSSDKAVLAVDIPTIETVGGGSSRCMVAEIFLEPRFHSLS